MKNSLVVLLLLGITALAADHFTFQPGTSINCSTLKQLRASELDKLNSFRVEHGVPKLVFNSTLQKAAQTYAKHLCKTLTFDHSPEASSGKYGQNLYKGMAYPSIQYEKGTATQKWQDERSNYNYRTGKAIDPRKMIGHFTAQIWKKVTSVGFGFCITTQQYAYSSRSTLNFTVMYVVANYYPTPNVVGQFTQNVFPPV